MLYHSIKDFGFGYLLQHPSEPVFLAVLNLIIAQGYLAVDFFFVLSGFILAYNYIGPDGMVRGGNRAFWVARVARLYPVYLLGIALGLVEYLGDTHAPALEATTIASHLLLVQSWIPKALAFDFNPPAWSLAAEALFYALFPLFLLFCARFGGRGLPLVAGGAWATYTLVLVSLAVLGQKSGLASHPSWNFVVSFNPLIRLPEFIVGMAIGLFFIRTVGTERATSGNPRRRMATVHDLGIVVLLGELGVVFVLAPKITTYLPVTNVMAVFAIPLLAPLIYVLALQQGLLAWALSLPFVAWLGEISYGIYIVHWPLWYLWNTYATRLLPFPSNSIWSLGFYLISLVAIAGISFKYLEGPTRRAIRTRWGKPKPLAAAIPQPVLVGR